MSLLKCCKEGECSDTCTKKVMKFRKVTGCDCLYVQDTRCPFKPKPASTFTELGLSFAARMTNRHNQISGTLESSSKECVRVNKKRLEGKVDFGNRMGIRLGPKPPQWLLTGQTTAPFVRMYAQVYDIETVSLDLINVDFDTLPNNMYALYIATNCCGTKGANDGEGGCRSCTVVKSCCSAKTCANQSVTGHHCQCECEAKGCEDVDICNCTHDSKKCTYEDPVPYVEGCFDDTPRAVELNTTIQEWVVKQVTNAQNGCCFTGWTTVDMDPQDISTNNPGEFIGMLDWDCTSTLKKLKANTFKTNPSNVTKKARNLLEVSEDKLNFNGYADSTVFKRVSLCVVYRREETDDEALLVRLKLYVPGTSGSPIRYTCGYNACVALNDLFIL